jgi:hypothetical protein
VCLACFLRPAKSAYRTAVLTSFGENEMDRPNPVIAVFVLAVFLLSPLVSLGQVAHQGKADPNEFRSPMVLDTVFLLTDPQTWKGAWVTGRPWAELRLFYCDNVSIGALGARVKSQTSESLNIEIRMMLSNRKGHDKEVKVRLELLDAETVVATAQIGPLQVDEQKSKTRTVELIVPKSAVKTDPVTPMRITVTARDI